MRHVAHVHVSTADWVVIAVVAVAGLYGVATGFLRGAFSLAGFAVGAYLGARIAPLILSDGSPYIPVVALGGAILLGTLMRGLAGMLAGMLRTSIGVIPGMRLLDRFAGLVLGLVAGVFLCWAIGAVLLYLPGETELRRSVQRSLILTEINDVVPPERLLEELERVDPIGVFLGPPAIVAPPDTGLAKDPDVVRASNSVVRVTGIACGLGVEGSGGSRNAASSSRMRTSSQASATRESTPLEAERSPRRWSRSTRPTTSPCSAFPVSVRGRSRSRLLTAARRSRSSAIRRTGRSLELLGGSVEPPRFSAGMRMAAGR